MNNTSAIDSQNIISNNPNIHTPGQAAPIFNRKILLLNKAMPKLASTGTPTSISDDVQAAPQPKSPNLKKLLKLIMSRQAATGTPTGALTETDKLFQAVSAMLSKSEGAVGRSVSGQSESAVWASLVTSQS